MIMQTSKPMKNCSKQELMLLLNGQLEDQEKLVKLLEKVMKDKKEVDSNYLDGFKSAIAIVRYFYHMEKEVAE